MQEFEQRDRSGRPKLSQTNFRVPSSRSSYGNTPEWVEKATKDFLDSAGDSDFGVDIKKMPYTKPALRDSIKRRILAGSKGGRPGQWSARKAQLVAQEYRRAGGGYRGKPARTQRSLKKWTKERWTTADGKPANRKGRMTRYLPAAAWKRLTPAQRRATIAKKLSGDKRGRQFVPNTERAAGASRAIRSKTLGPNVEEVAKNPNSPQIFVDKFKEQVEKPEEQQKENSYNPDKSKLNELNTVAYYGDNEPIKPFVRGNIDIDSRTPVEKQDGSLAVIDPIIVDGAGDDAGMFIIVPRITKFGQIVDDVVAKSQFAKTGDHLGKFKTSDEAQAYADWLSGIEEEIVYRDKKKPITSIVPLEKLAESTNDGFESRRRSIRNKIQQLTEKYLKEKSLGPALRAANSVQIYDPDAIDADGDGLVQDATPWMRPALPSSPIIAGLRSAKNSNIVSQRAMKEAQEFVNFVSQHEPELTEMMKGLANKKGSSLYLRGLKNRQKTADSLALKAQRLQHLFDGDLTDSITSMNDPLRYTFESDDVNKYTKDVLDVISALAKKGHKASVTNYWTSGDPYKGVNVMVDHPDGFFYEIQFHTPSSYRLKNKLTPLYEKYRDEKNIKKRQEIYDEMLKLSKGVSIPKDIGQFGEPLSRGSGKADFKPARPGKLIPTPIGLNSRTARRGLSSQQIQRSDIPQRLPVPDNWFISDTERSQVERNFPDFHLRWDDKWNMYLPATGRLKETSGGYESFADTELAGAYLTRKYWHPAIAPSDSRVASVMNKWRSDFSDSRAITRALAGLDVASNFDSPSFRKDVQVLGEALSDSVPLGMTTYRVARLTPDVGRSAQIGDELNFAAAAVAFSPKDAQGFDFDELSIANAPSKFMFEFPIDTHGLIFDDGGEKAAKRPFAEGGDKSPKEAIVAGKFRIARIEKREVQDPYKRRGVMRDVYVLESVNNAEKLRKGMSSSSAKLDWDKRVNFIREESARQEKLLDKVTNKQFNEKWGPLFDVLDMNLELSDSELRLKNKNNNLLSQAGLDDLNKVFINKRNKIRENPLNYDSPELQRLVDAVNEFAPDGENKEFVLNQITEMLRLRKLYEATGYRKGANDRPMNRDFISAREFTKLPYRGAWIYPDGKIYPVFWHGDEHNYTHSFKDGIVRLDTVRVTRPGKKVDLTVEAQIEKLTPSQIESVIELYESFGQPKLVWEIQGDFFEFDKDGDIKKQAKTARQKILRESLSNDLYTNLTSVGGMSSRRREMTESEKSRFRPITLAPDEKVKLQPGTTLVYANEDDQIIRTELIGPQVARVRGIPGLKLYTDPNPDNQDEVDAQMREWDELYGPVSSPQRQARGRGGQPDRTARERERPRTTNEDPIDRILRETEEARSRRGMSSRTNPATSKKYFHGSPVKLDIGEVIRPPSETGETPRSHPDIDPLEFDNANYVYLTSNQDEAASYASDSGSSTYYVYEVEPLSPEEIETDPEVEMGLSNDMDSVRVQRGVKIVGRKEIRQERSMDSRRGMGSRIDEMREIRRAREKLNAVSQPEELDVDENNDDDDGLTPKERAAEKARMAAYEEFSKITPEELARRKEMGRASRERLRSADAIEERRLARVRRNKGKETNIHNADGTIKNAEEQKLYRERQGMGSRIDSKYPNISRFFSPRDKDMDERRFAEDTLRGLSLDRAEEIASEHAALLDAVKKKAKEDLVSIMGVDGYEKWGENWFSTDGLNLTESEARRVDAIDKKATEDELQITNNLYTALMSASEGSRNRRQRGIEAARATRGMSSSKSPEHQLAKSYFEILTNGGNPTEFEDLRFNSLMDNQEMLDSVLGYIAPLIDDLIKTGKTGEEIAAELDIPIIGVAFAASETPSSRLASMFNGEAIRGPRWSRFAILYTLLRNPDFFLYEDPYAENPELIGIDIAKALDVPKTSAMELVSRLKRAKQKLSIQEYADIFDIDLATAVSARYHALMPIKDAPSVAKELGMTLVDFFDSEISDAIPAVRSSRGVMKEFGKEMLLEDLNKEIDRLNESGNSIMADEFKTVLNHISETITSNQTNTDEMDDDEWMQWAVRGEITNALIAGDDRSEEIVTDIFARIESGEEIQEIANSYNTTSDDIATAIVGFSKIPSDEKKAAMYVYRSLIPDNPGLPESNTAHHVMGIPNSKLVAKFLNVSEDDLAYFVREYAKDEMLPNDYLLEAFAYHGLNAPFVAKVLGITVPEAIELLIDEDIAHSERRLSKGFRRTGFDDMSRSAQRGGKFNRLIEDDGYSIDDVALMMDMEKSDVLDSIREYETAISQIRKMNVIPLPDDTDE